MSLPAPIKGILFDLDGTLRHNRPASNDVFLDCAARLGAPDSPSLRLKSTRWTHYYWASSPELTADLAAFGEDEDGFWLNYGRRNLAAFECPPHQADRLAPEVHRYMKENHQPEDWIPPEVPAALSVLKEAGLRLGVLSNRTQPVTGYLQAVGLAQYFDLALVAGEVNAWKPDPRIFHHAVQRMGVPAGATLYIGDNYYADVLGAQNAGLQPVLIDPLGLFPEASCPVIHTLAQLPDLLESCLPTPTPARSILSRPPRRPSTQN